jgi:hypothetical protein
LFFKKALPKPNPNSESSYNGCGSYNFNINFEQYDMGDFDKCCNIHDMCYSGCNNPKLDCDKALSGCLNSACKRWELEDDWELKHKLCKYNTKFYILSLY